MLAVRLNKAQFEYDIHSIIKAFYPAETVKVFEEGTKDFESDGDNPQITIRFGEKEIRVELSGTEYETALSSPEERPVVKNELKQLLYRILSAHTGKQLPWGNTYGEYVPQRLPCSSSKPEPAEIRKQIRRVLLLRRKYWTT